MSNASEKFDEELQAAFDFDPADPMLGLRAEELHSAQITRRTALKLLAATGLLLKFPQLVGPHQALAQGKGGELIVGWNTDKFDNLDPAFMNKAIEFQVGSNIFNGLTHIDKDLVPRGDLAESWEVSPDGLQWTFRLRRGVKFHNGTAFDADDVLFTYNRTLDPAVASIHKGVLEPVQQVEKLDTHTVRFLLKRPSAAFLMKILERSSGRAMTIVNQEAITTLGKDYNITPIGTGAFRVAEHKPGDRLVLERFADYFVQGQPLLDRIVIRPIPEPTTLVAALETGDVHFVDSPPAQFIDRLEQNGDIQLSSAPDPGFQSILLPFNKKPFDDRRVRLAIAKAIDRPDLVKRGLFGRGLPGYGPIPAAQKAFFRDQSETSPQRFDPEGAKKLLAEAGFPNGFKNTMVVTPTTKRVGQIITEMLKKHANIEFELDVVDFSVMIKRFYASEYEVMLLGSGGDPDPDDSLDDWFKTTSKFNTFKYSNPEADKLIEAERTAIELEKRRALVHQAEDVVAADVAAVFLYHNVDVTAMRKNVKGFVHVPGLRDFHTVSLG
jgi:ABC-type transport system substrate-binding protein